MVVSTKYYVVEPRRGVLALTISEAEHPELFGRMMRFNDIQEPIDLPAMTVHIFAGTTSLGSRKCFQLEGAAAK